MPRIVAFLLIFVPTLFLGDRLIALASHKLVGLSNDRYVQMYEGRAKADILVIGNSRADNHFPPQMMSSKLGRPVVNLGLGGMSVVLAEALIADYIDRNGAPTLIVLEPGCLTVNPSSVGDMRLFAIYSERIEHLIRHYMPAFYYASQIFRSFNFNTEMFLRALAQIRSLPSDRLHATTMTPELLEVVRSRPSLPLSNHPDNEAAFTRLLTFVRAHKIALRVVVTPYLPDQMRKIPNYAAWRARLLELGVRKEELYDFSTSFDRIDYFRDGLHLNTEGTTHLLQLMIDDDFYD